MDQKVRVRRKNKFNFVREAEKLESFDDFPMLRSTIDPQLHLSRNTVDQPFALRSEKDSVIGQATGASRIVFVDGPVRYFDTEPGDYVYIPGGQAHRVLVVRPGIMLRYKARDWGSEQVVWYCPDCGGEVFAYDAEQSGGPVQSAYAEACDAFNESDEARTCKSCNHVQAPVETGHFRWRAVADAIVSQEDDAE